MPMNKFIARRKILGSPQNGEREVRGAVCRETAAPNLKPEKAAVALFAILIKFN